MDLGCGTSRGFTSSIRLPWTNNYNNNKETSTNNSVRRPESRQITDNNTDQTFNNDQQVFE